MFYPQLAYLRIKTAKLLHSIASRVDFKAPYSPNSLPDDPRVQKTVQAAPEASEGQIRMSPTECLAAIHQRWAEREAEKESRKATAADITILWSAHDDLEAKIKEAVSRIDTTLTVIEESITDLHAAHRRTDAAVSRLEDR